MCVRRFWKARIWNFQVLWLFIGFFSTRVSLKLTKNYEKSPEEDFHLDSLCDLAAMSRQGRPESFYLNKWCISMKHMKK